VLSISTNRSCIIRFVASSTKTKSVHGSPRCSNQRPARTLISFIE
jgi:hypothetical protein